MSFKAFLVGFLATALAWPLAANADMGGPDRGGYEWLDSAEDGVTYDWQDLTTDGETLQYETLGDDDEVGPIELPFDFEFYGTTYNQIYIGSNGFISFQSNAFDLGFIGQCPLPVADGGSVNTPDLAIYAYYQDWNPTEDTGAANEIFHGVIGTEVGSRMYVVTWNEVELFQQAPDREPEPWGSDPATFQVVLYEGSNEIQVNIQESTELGGLPRWSSNTTIGLENIDGTVGIGTCDWTADHLVPDEYAVRFVQSDGYGVFPPTQTEIGTPGDTITFPLEVLNFSDAEAEATIAVESSAGWTATPVPATVTVPADDVGAFDVDVDVPDTATAADSDVLTVTVTIGGEEITATLEVGLTHPNDDWQIIADLPDGRRYHSVAAVGDHLYSVGGEYTEVVGDMVMFHLTDSFFSYDPAANQWSCEVAQLPYPVSRGGACAMNGLLYVVGGIQQLADTDAGTPALYVSDTLVYDPAANEWSMLTPPPTLVSGAAVVCDEAAGLIYVINGWLDNDGDGEFDPVSADEPDNTDNTDPSIQVYDVAADEWDVSLTPPESPTTAAAAGLVNGEILIAGGNLQQWQEDTSEWGFFITRGTQIYDIASDEWRDGGFLDEFQANGAGLVFEDQFCIIGGDLNDGTPLDIWQCYADPLWITQVDTLSYGRAGMGAAVLGEHIYGIGGASSVDQVVDRSERWPVGDLEAPGDPVGCETDGDADGDADGDGDGDADGDTDGDSDGDTDGDSDGDTDGDTDGDSDGDSDSDGDGCNCAVSPQHIGGDALPALLLIGLVAALRRRDR